MIREGSRRSPSYSKRVVPPARSTSVTSRSRWSHPDSVGQPVGVGAQDDVAALVVLVAGGGAGAVDQLHDVVAVVVGEAHGVAEAVDHGGHPAPPVVDHHVGRRPVGGGDGGDAVVAVLVAGLAPVLLDLGQDPPGGVVDVAADHHAVGIGDRGEEPLLVVLVGDVAGVAAHGGQPAVGVVGVDGAAAVGCVDRGGEPAGDVEAVGDPAAGGAVGEPDRCGGALDGDVGGLGGEGGEHPVAVEREGAVVPLAEQPPVVELGQHLLRRRPPTQRIMCWPEHRAAAVGSPERSTAPLDAEADVDERRPSRTNAPARGGRGSCRPG